MRPNPLKSINNIKIFIDPDRADATTKPIRILLTQMLATVVDHGECPWNSVIGRPAFEHLSGLLGDERDPATDQMTVPAQDTGSRDRVTNCVTIGADSGRRQRT